MNESLVFAFNERIFLENFLFSIQRWRRRRRISCRVVRSMSSVIFSHRLWIQFRRNVLDDFHANVNNSYFPLVFEERCESHLRFDETSGVASFLYQCDPEQSNQIVNKATAKESKWEINYYSASRRRCRLEWNVTETIEPNVNACLPTFSFSHGLCHLYSWARRNFTSPSGRIAWLITMEILEGIGAQLSNCTRIPFRGFIKAVCLSQHALTSYWRAFSHLISFNKHRIHRRNPFPKKD